MTFKFCVFIFAFFSFCTNAGERWAIDCVSGKVVLSLIKKADIVVNSNQIVISTKVVRNDNKMSFFLEGPAESGTWWNDAQLG